MIDNKNLRLYFRPARGDTKSSLETGRAIREMYIRDFMETWKCSREIALAVIGDVAVKTKFDELPVSD